jgi:hypothetical protein
MYIPDFLYGEIKGKKEKGIRDKETTRRRMITQPRLGPD